MAGWLAGWLTHDEDDDVEGRDEERGRGGPHELSDPGGHLCAQDAPAPGPALHCVGLGVLQGGGEGAQKK